MYNFNEGQYSVLQNPKFKPNAQILSFAAHPNTPLPMTLPSSRHLSFSLPLTEGRAGTARELSD
jgi:hypothetical protein